MIQAIRSLKVPILASLLLMAVNAHAGGRESLDAFTKGLKGLDGQFTQQVYDSKGKRKESASGRVALSAPRLFRWEYLKPYPQLIVADGKKVWVYDPDLKQVSTRPQGAEEQNSPLAALIDPQKLDRDFTVAEAGAQGGLEWRGCSSSTRWGSVPRSHSAAGSATPHSPRKLSDSFHLKAWTWWALSRLPESSRRRFFR
jgi:outer membrane lipoprotein carrier protein